MNWKKEAMEKLRHYGDLCRASDTLRQEIARLEQEDGGLDRLALRGELEERLSRVEHWLSVMDDALEGLTEEERLVLRRMYIDREKGGAERLCEELGFEIAEIYRRRSRALERFTRLFYGVGA